MFFGSITETALIKWQVRARLPFAPPSFQGGRPTADDARGTSQESVNVSVTGGFGSKSREAFLDVLVRAPPASLSTV